MTTKNLLQQLIAVMLFLVQASNAIAQTEDAGLSFSETQKNWIYGNAFEHPALTNPHNLPVTYSSSDSDIAYFNEEGEFTATGWAGQTTITASFAGDNTYAPATASYTLVVSNSHAIYYKDYLVVTDFTTNTSQYKTVPGIKKYSPIEYSATTKVSSNGFFQFNSSAGIYSTNSVCYLRHISIEWSDTENTIGNKYGLTFYGLTTKPSSFNFDENKLLTTVYCNNTVSLDIDDNCNYVGIKPISSAVYVKSITITWQKQGASELLPTSEPTVKYQALVGKDNGQAYAMTSNMQSSVFTSTPVTLVEGKILTNEPNNYTWKITYHDNGATYIQDKDDKYLNYGGNTRIFNSNSDTPKVWHFTDNAFMWPEMSIRYIVWEYNEGNSKFNLLGSGKDAEDGFALAHPCDINDYARSVSSGSWGTICLPGCVPADHRLGATYYAVVAKRLDADNQPEALYLQSVETLESGRGYLYQSDTDASAIAFVYDPTTEQPPSPVAASDNNGVAGTLNDKFTVSTQEDIYMVSGEKIVKAASGSTVGKNRAYIIMSEVPEIGSLQQAPQRCIKFDLKDGIATRVDMAHEIDNNPACMYDMSGRHVADTNKAGLYIKQGKKYATK